MNSLLSMLIGLTLASIWSPSLVAQADSNQSQLSQDNRKAKDKAKHVIERDKSKPVRTAIEDWYARNTEAFKRKDVAAVMALRTDDFHTVLPDGKKNTRADMQTYTERFLGRIEQWISLDFQIGVIEMQDRFGDEKGEFASADVTQKTVRMQRFPDGTFHKVESAVVQRETWKKTAEGWKLYCVDNIRDGDLLVDDKPFKPNQ